MRLVWMEWRTTFIFDVQKPDGIPLKNISMVQFSKFAIFFTTLIATDQKANV